MRNPFKYPLSEGTLETDIIKIKCDIVQRKENLYRSLRDSLLTPIFLLIQLRRFNYADI
jgi:hypothetical protein